jgi:MFS family permease
MNAPSATQSLWRDPRFRKVWVAETAPLAGTAISTLALPLVAVLTLHASALAVGVLGALAYLPFLALSLPLGVLIDRRARRPVLILAELARFCAWGSVPIASLAGVLAISQLFIVQAVLGVATVVSDIAGQAILPSILPEDRLIDGNAKLAVGETACDVAGPVVCGALVSAASAPAALGASALSAAMSASLLSRLEVDEQIEADDNTRSVGVIAHGWRLTFRDHLLRRFALWAAIYNGAQGVVTAVLLLFMARDLHLSATLIGLLFSIGYGTAFVAVLGVNRLSERVGLGRCLVSTAAIAALSYIILPLTPHGGAPAAVLVALALLVDEGASAMSVVLVSSVRIALIEPRLMGRVMASARFLTMGAIPVGALIGGALGGSIGYRATLAVGAGLMFLSIPVISSRTIASMHGLPGRRVGVTLPDDLPHAPLPA